MKTSSEWLEQELCAWVRDDIISADAAEQIRSRYEKSEAGRSNLASTIFTAFGAIMVSLGIIAIFAYNWEELPRSARAVIAFALLISAQAFSVFVKLKRPESSLFREASGVFLPIAFTTALAIIAQTYQLGGDLVQFTLVVIALTLPSLYLINSTAAGAIFIFAIAALISALYDGVGNLGWNEYHFKLTIAWIYFIVWLPWYIARLIKDRFSYSTRSLNLLFMLAIIAIVNSYLGGGLRDLALHNSILLASFWLANTLIYPNETRLFWKPVEEITKFAIAVMLLIYSCYSPYDRSYYSGYEYDLPVFFYIMAMFYFVLIGYFVHKIARERLYELIIPIAPFLFYAAFFAKTDMTLFFSFFTFVGAAAFIFGGVKRMDLALTNQGSIWLVALILIKFFSSNASFLTKGVVFVIVGIAFMVFSVYVRKLIKESANVVAK
ncbi:hypothetical protein FACS189487_11380 [Campylobacterota bacterium]|nr:hypothetical protein FACS189487_11380 [Campylobacterota bacterium]